VAFQGDQSTLADATTKTNADNMRMNVRNTSGKNGVHKAHRGNSHYWWSIWQENGNPKTGPLYRYLENDEASERRAFESASHDRDEADRRTGCLNGKRPKHIMVNVE
jgi:hypothetical protein